MYLRYKNQIYITGDGGAGGNDLKYNVNTIESDVLCSDL